MPKLALLVVLSLAVVTPSLSQQDTLFTSIEADLEYYDPAYQGYMPFVLNMGITTNAISFNISHGYLKYNWLTIHASEGISLHDEGNIIYRFLKDTVVFFTTKRMSVGDRFTLYQKEGIKKINIQLAKINDHHRSSLIAVYPKQDSYFSNLMVMLLIVILAFYAYIRATGSEVTTGHFRWWRAVSFRTISEALYKTRMFEKGNVQVIIALSLLIGTALTSGFYYAGFTSVIGKQFGFTNFSEGLMNWMIISAGVFIGFVIKNVLINAFSNLYKFNATKRVHFFNYVRLSSIIYTTFLTLICIRVFVYQYDGIVSFAHSLLLILLALRALVLFIKLLNAGSYRILHLFSYLCATELVPYVVLVRITFL